MFANIRHQDALLRQLTTRVSIAPPTENQLRVPTWQSIACKLSLLPLPLGTLIVLFAGCAVEGHGVDLLFEKEHFFFFKALIYLVSFGSIVAWFIILIWLASVGYKRMDLTSFEDFSMSWAQPLSGSDCTQALSLIQSLRTDGAPEYHAAVLAQHRPFYGFDLEVLRRVQYAKQQEDARINKTNQEIADAQACKALHGV